MAASPLSASSSTPQKSWAEWGRPSAVTPGFALKDRLTASGLAARNVGRYAPPARAASPATLRMMDAPSAPTDGPTTNQDPAPSVDPLHAQLVQKLSNLEPLLRSLYPGR